MWLLRSLKVAAILTPIVPAGLGYLICRMIGLTYYTFNLNARRNVLENLRHVGHRMSWVRRQITAARICMTVVMNYYDLIRLRSVDREAIFELVDIEGLEQIDRALEAKCGVIILSAHLGNFSVMARLPAALGLRAAVIAERVDPPSLFAYVARLRSAMGIEVIAPGPSSVRNVIRLLRENGILLVAGDRDVSNQGTSVRFFGVETTLPTGPVLLAMRTGAALVPAYTVRTSTHHSRVVIDEPMSLRCTGDWDADLQVNLQRMANQLERMILNDPGQWAVLQRVWPPRSHFGRSEGIGGIDEYLPWLRQLRDPDDERRAG